MGIVEPGIDLATVGVVAIAIAPEFTLTFTELALTFHAPPDGETKRSLAGDGVTSATMFVIRLEIDFAPIRGVSVAIIEAWFAGGDAARPTRRTSRVRVGDFAGRALPSTRLAKSASKLRIVLRHAFASAELLVIFAGSKRCIGASTSRACGTRLLLREAGAAVFLLLEFVCTRQIVLRFSDGLRSVVAAAHLAEPLHDAAA
jgi:hypothetical protein